MVPVAAVVAKVASAARNVAAVAARARSAQKAYRSAAYVQATYRVAQQSTVYRVGNQFKVAAAGVHAKAQAVEAKTGRAVAAATSPSVVLDGLDSGSSWLTAAPDVRRPMPRGVKWTAVFVVVTYLPFTLVQVVPDLPVLPGVAWSPSWGTVWRLAGGVSLGGPAAPVPDRGPGGVQPQFQGSAWECTGVGTSDAYTAQQAGASAVVPYLSTLAEGAGVAVKEKVADPDNVAAYWKWVNGLAKVAVGAFSGGLLGGDAAAGDPAVEEYEAGVRGEAQAVADRCACPSGVAAQPGTGAVVARQAAAAAGFTGEDLEVAVAVAGAESGYVPTAANPSSTARGMWQIMLSAHRDLPDVGRWQDPYANARMAYAIWRDAGGWSPWAVYNSGAYKKYLNTGAVPAVQGGCADGRGRVVDASYGPGAWGGYANGRIPSPALCSVAGQPGKLLRCDAARAFDAVSAAYTARFGTPLPVTDAYRSYDEQVSCRVRKGSLCADPGTSNHGWGLATDLGGGVQSFGTAQHDWMVANGPEFGWVLPGWAQPGGSKPEPWHFEYRATVSAG